MKKTYIKPDLLIENFVLSERIATCTSEDPAFSAGDCTVVVNNEIVEGLRAATGISNLFTGTHCGTQITGGVDTDFNKAGIELCYHTSSGTSTGYDNIFNS